MNITTHTEKSFEMARATSQHLITIAGAALAFLTSIAHEPKALTLCGSSRHLFTASVGLLALSVGMGCWTQLKFITIYAGAHIVEPSIDEPSLRWPFALQIIILLAGVISVGIWLIAKIA